MRVVHGVSNYDWVWMRVMEALLPQDRVGSCLVVTIQIPTVVNHA